jgi:hypothetical protein
MDSPCYVGWMVEDADTAEDVADEGSGQAPGFSDVVLDTVRQ